MAKISSQKPQPKAGSGSKKKKTKTNWRQIIIVGGLSVALISILLPSIMSKFGGGKAARNITSNQPAAMAEPQFIKEGELSFISSETGAEIRKIDIEKADNDMERGFGMMYRKSVPETQGMLFLFDESTPQSFWMKNTYVSLDILFVDEAFTITTIHHRTTPLSEASVHSKGNARYVVEVVGGYCEKYGIKEGDKIKF